MITAFISGNDITGLVDFFESYNKFTELKYWNQWDLASKDKKKSFSKLFTFMYTNFMNIINSDLTITVMVEFTSKSDSKIVIIAAGGKKGVLQFDNGSEHHCEQQIFKDLRDATNPDWAIREVISSDFQSNLYSINQH